MTLAEQALRNELMIIGDGISRRLSPCMSCMTTAGLHVDFELCGPNSGTWSAWCSCGNMAEGHPTTDGMVRNWNDANRPVKGKQS